MVFEMFSENLNMRSREYSNWPITNELGSHVHCLMYVKSDYDHPVYYN